MFSVQRHGHSALAAMVLVVFACSSGTAASLLVYAPTPEVSVIQESSAVPRLSIRLKNQGFDPAEMVVWAVVLEVVPEPGASGSVKLSAPIVPADYIYKDFLPFGMIFGPDPPPASSSTYTDFAATPGGALIPVGLDGGLFDVDLIVSPDALGKFSVIMRSFDENSLIGSSWSSFTDMATPIPFGNAGSDEHLMTIVDVKTAPEPTGGLLSLGAIAGLLCIGRRPSIC